MKRVIFLALCLIFMSACHFESNAVFRVQGTLTPGLPIQSDFLYTVCMRADVDGIWDVRCWEAYPDASGKFSKIFTFNDPPAPASLVDISLVEFKARMSVLGRPQALKSLNAKVTKTQVDRRGGTINIEISP